MSQSHLPNSTESLDNAAQTEETLFRSAVDRAKQCAADEQWDEAIAYYKKALELRSQAWIYLCIGQLLAKKEEYDGAISYYRKAISVNPNNATVYVFLGIALELKGNGVGAIASYQKALALEMDQPAWVHLGLANLLVNQARKGFLSAVEHYTQVIEKTDSLDNLKPLKQAVSKLDSVEQHMSVEALDDYRYANPNSTLQKESIVQRLLRLGFLESDSAVNPKGYYFINERLKAVYCSIPKNACTLFKTMMVEQSELVLPFQSSGENVHVFFDQNMQEVSASRLLNCLCSPAYFKFVVLRDPFKRLVSAYLDKIAKHATPEPFAQSVIKNVQSHLGIEEDLEQSITFSQFVDYLVRTPDSSLNDHWRPQSNFVGNTPFDFIGRFEDLGNVINVIENKFQIKIKQNVSSHRTKYGKYGDAEFFDNVYPQQLRMLDALPDFHHFYTKPIAQKISSRYDRDFQLYERCVKA